MTFYSTILYKMFLSQTWTDRGSDSPSRKELLALLLGVLTVGSLQTKPVRRQNILCHCYPRLQGLSPMAECVCVCVCVCVARGVWRWGVGQEFWTDGELRQWTDSAGLPLLILLLPSHFHRC